MDGPGQGKRGRGAISRDSDGPKWPAPAWVKGWYGEIRVKSHNASHNFPRENDPKIRPANPPYKEPVARKKQGQRFTKNDH